MSLLDLLLPPACVGCGAHGGLLCARCASDLRPPSRAADRFVAADAGVVLGSHLALGVSAFAYEGSLRRTLAQLKYAGAGRVAPLLARAGLPAFNALVAVSGPAVLTPVPVHLERRRSRGYNQAALIARELGTAVGMPVDELLVRSRSTAKMHRLDRAARLRNLRGAISLSAGADVPEVVIVVDDIITTSATLDACAVALQAGGARDVYGYAVAREV